MLPTPGAVCAETARTPHGPPAVHDAEHADGRCAAPDALALPELWRALLDDVRSEIPQHEFDTWLSDTRLVDMLDDMAVVAAPTVFAREQISASYQSAIERLFHQHVGRTIGVTLVIG